MRILLILKEWLCVGTREGRKEGRSKWGENGNQAFVFEEKWLEQFKLEKEKKKSYDTLLQ